MKILDLIGEDLSNINKNLDIYIMCDDNTYRKPTFEDMAFLATQDLLKIVRDSLISVEAFAFIKSPQSKLYCVDKENIKDNYRKAINVKDGVIPNQKKFVTCFVIDELDVKNTSVIINMEKYQKGKIAQLTLTVLGKNELNNQVTARLDLIENTEDVKKSSNVFSGREKILKYVKRYVTSIIEKEYQSGLKSIEKNRELALKNISDLEQVYELFKHSESL